MYFYGEVTKSWFVYRQLSTQNALPLMPDDDLCKQLDLYLAQQLVRHDLDQKGLALSL